MSRGQPARVPPSPRDAVVPPDVFRFSIQKVDRLHLARMEKRYEGIPDGADILNVKDEPVCRNLRNVDSVDGPAREIVDLFEVERSARLHLLWREVSAAAAWRRAGQSVGAYDERLPLLMSGRPVTHPRGSRAVAKSCDCGRQRGEANLSPTGARGWPPVAAEIGLAPEPHGGGIIQTGVGRNGLLSAGRLRPYLRVGLRLTEQHYREYKPDHQRPAG
jgi:hypothetical protein